MNLPPVSRRVFARHHLLAALFGFAGVQHFRKPEPFDTLVPAKLPGSARAWTYGSGVAELATAAALVVPKTRRLGGWMTVVLMLGVWPGNFQMVANWRDKSLPLRVLSWARLPLQLPLIVGGWKIAHEDKS
ncbi:DoxX family protein [Corynebacterium aquilae]|uniref:DoxX family protein n=1 Tax=Corynebacterium aquilae TaxID=203263 RepID=UPI001FEAA2CF|nr:MauE/DoxX family redox-associated membrane protein [Corynebacterium aquilae]